MDVLPVMTSDRSQDTGISVILGVWKSKKTSAALYFETGTRSEGSKGRSFDTPLFAGVSAQAVNEEENHVFMEIYRKAG